MSKDKFSMRKNVENNDSSTRFSSETNNKEIQLYMNKCCKEIKCTCTLFLWKGVNVDLGSSDEGMYGETREKSLRNIFQKMSIYGLDETSILLDIGSGRGVPNIVASYQNLPFSSVGIELDEKAYYLSLSNLLYTLESNKNLQKEKESKENISENKNSVPINEEFFFPRNRLGFMKGDATLLETFEPVTHIYSFDAAMPIWMVKKFVDLFNLSATTYCYVSYRKDLIDKLQLNAKRIHGISTRMMGSGEGRMCWLYLKDNWSVIKTSSEKHIFKTYSKKSHSDKELEKCKLSKISTLHEIVQFSTLNIHTQISMIEIALNEWFKSRKSRKECLLERKLMNQRHKELKKSFMDEKQRKENLYQLTLEDVGVSSNRSVIGNKFTANLDDEITKRNKKTSLKTNSSEGKNNNIKEIGIHKDKITNLELPIGKTTKLTRSRNSNSKVTEPKGEIRKKDT